MVLMIIAEDAEVSFEALIYSFSLTVGLRMKGGGFAGINLEDESKCGLEIGCENGTTMQYN